MHLLTETVLPGNVPKDGIALRQLDVTINVVGQLEKKTKLAALLPCIAHLQTHHTDYAVSYVQLHVIKLSRENFQAVPLGVHEDGSLQILTGGGGGMFLILHSLDM